MYATGGKYQGVERVITDERSGLTQGSVQNAIQCSPYMLSMPELASIVHPCQPIEGKTEGCLRGSIEQ
jgi:hypothetical protein